MFTKNMKAGYQGRKDEMRDKAQRLMKDGGDAPDVYYSKSCADKVKIRPYKDGGHVKQREETMGRIENFKDEMEKHKQHVHHENIEHLKKGGEVDMKKGKTDKTKEGKRKDCSVQKFAMGGVAKIRHDEATKSGLPTKPKKGSVRDIM